VQLAGHLLAHLEQKRLGAGVAVEYLLERPVDAGEAFAAIPCALVRGGFWVEGEDAEGGEKELGQVPVTQLAVFPESLAALGDGLEDELDGAHGNFPADQKAEVPSNVGALRRDGQALQVEDGLELGQQADDEVLVGIPAGGGNGVYLLKREAAQQLQDDVVDVAPKGEVPPRVGQPQEQRRRRRGRHAIRRPPVMSSTHRPVVLTDADACWRCLLAGGAGMRGTAGVVLTASVVSSLSSIFLPAVYPPSPFFSFSGALPAVGASTVSYTVLTLVRRLGE
jgi:hypothetical protein